MSANWAERERDTNRLVRAIAKYLFENDKVVPEKLYALGKLTWITKSYEGDNPSYIASTKIPALGEALGVEVGRCALPEVARMCSRAMNSSDVEQLILRHTGFTNFYSAYRNSVRGWVEDNFETLADLYGRAYRASGLDDRRQIMTTLTDMSGIPKANHPEVLMRSEYYVTPVLFSLDPKLHLPLINGNEWVQNVLAALDVTDSSLEDQFRAMTRMLGHSGIEDAADLDQVGRAMGKRAIDFVRTETKPPTKALLRRKETRSEKPLQLKDEADIQIIQKGGHQTQRRKHNELTNALQNALGDYTLVEGVSADCMFDVLVKSYDEDGNDLLIEAKNSAESANIRMAIGQLYHYWFGLGNDVKETHVAVLVPDKPSDDVIRFLRQMEIGLFWFQSGQLVTNDDWLVHLAGNS